MKKKNPFKHPIVIFLGIAIGTYTALLFSMNPADSLLTHIGFIFMFGLHLIYRAIEKDKTIKNYGTNEKRDATLDELNRLEAKYNKDKEK